MRPVINYGESAAAADSPLVSEYVVAAAETLRVAIEAPEQCVHGAFLRLGGESSNAVLEAVTDQPIGCGEHVAHA